MQKDWLSKFLVASVLVTSTGPITAKAAEKELYLPSQQKLYQQVGVNSTAIDMEEVKISKEQAIEIAKKTINIDKGYKFQGITFSTQWYGNKPVWQMSWYKEDKGYHGIYITVNAQTGNVVNINIYHEKDGNMPFPPKVSYDQAVDVAKQYIQKLYPKKLNELVIDEQLKKQQGRLPYGERRFYAIRFYQMVDHVPYYENNIMITIDGNGEIRNFEYNWNDEVTFEKKENVISLDEARKLLKDRMELELRYQIDYSSKQAPKLIYVPKTNAYPYYQANFNAIIDAHTGKFIDMYGKPVEQTAPIDDKPLAESATPLPPRSKELTQKEAIEAVKRTMELPDSIELDSVNYEDRGETSVWVLGFRDNGEDTNYMYAEINAKTGELTRFDRNVMYYKESEANKNPQVNYTKEQALEIAKNFVKKVAPDKVDRLYATLPQEVRYDSKSNPLFYEMYFYRKENGIPVQGQGISVAVSAETGKIIRFFTEWRNVSFPLPTKVVSLEKAEEMYLEDKKLALSYFTTLTVDEKRNSTAILVYQPTPSWEEKYLDAVDGKWKDASTGRVVDDQNVATDIKGHKQEQALQAMIDYNIYDVENGKVYPERVVTKGEFVEVVMRAIGDYGTWYNENAAAPFKDVKKEADYYPYLQRAVDRRLIKVDEEYFHPTSQVTREFVAVTLVRALGYDKLASQTDLFPISFKDANKIQHKGHVGLISKLKIMPGTKSKEFQPSSSLTRADLAVIIYRFMNKYPDIAGN
ncbi:MAG: PepSY domain-containing protein [Anoxybacillus sp.]|nr:YcdB/YcdC domain-containing protein [Anoxybacillus sp.]MCL6585350.1 PepSY domain-containing protein [Anoxybacillus sp.]